MSHVEAPQQREALLTLLSHTRKQWTRIGGWNTSQPVEQWDGVTVENGHVIKLDLRYNRLEGTIPKELGDLKNLRYLRLDGNQLSGNIPPELGSLEKLTVLDLAFNQLSGPIPAALIGRLGVQITDVNFKRNALSLPEDIGAQTHLTKLKLSGQNLVGNIPPGLGDLKNLRYLDLHSNQLSGSIPPELGGLQKLQELNLHENKLSGSIPPELGRLEKLVHLDLGSPILYSVTDSRNQLTGNIPKELGKLAELRELDLSWKKLEGSIPPELGRLVQLTYLDLHSNQLTGNIPEALGSLAELRRLDLSGNYYLEGSIPPELGSLKKLERLSLSSNMSGSIPPELGRLVQLTYLRLDSNKLTGSIPPELGRLVQLTYLGLSYNQLSGSIPPELGRLVQLTHLDLSYNQLSGSIPPELGRLVQLTYLGLSDNQLSGSIPPELGRLVQLTYLRLHSNKLTGSIPPGLGRLVQLTHLSLNNNQLSGTIPLELGKLTELRDLGLSENNLVGVVPPSLLRKFGHGQDIHPGNNFSVVAVGQSEIKSSLSKFLLASDVLLYYWDVVSDIAAIAAFAKYSPALCWLAVIFLVVPTIGVAALSPCDSELCVFVDKLLAMFFCLVPVDAYRSYKNGRKTSGMVLLKWGESVFETIPQMLIQLYALLSRWDTDSVSNVLLISVFGSIFSLAWELMSILSAKEVEDAMQVASLAIFGEKAETVEERAVPATSEGSTSWYTSLGLFLWTSCASLAAYLQTLCLATAQRARAFYSAPRQSIGALCASSKRYILYGLALARHIGWHLLLHLTDILSRMLSMVLFALATGNFCFLALPWLLWTRWCIESHGKTTDDLGSKRMRLLNAFAAGFVSALLQDEARQVAVIALVAVENVFFMLFAGLGGVKDVPDRIVRNSIIIAATAMCVNILMRVAARFRFSFSAGDPTIKGEEAVVREEGSDADRVEDMPEFSPLGDARI